MPRRTQGRARDGTGPVAPSNGAGLGRYVSMPIASTRLGLGGIASPSLALKSWSTNTNLAPTFFDAYLKTSIEGYDVKIIDTFVSFTLNGASNPVYTNIGDTPPDGAIFNVIFPYAGLIVYSGTLTDSSSGVYNMQVNVTTEFGSVNSPVIQWTIVDSQAQRTRLGLSGFPRSYDYNLYPKTEISFGDLQAQPATMYGEGEVLALKDGAGALQASPSTVNGSGTPQEPADGWHTNQWHIDPTYGDSWYGTAVSVSIGTGALQAGVSTVSGSGELNLSGSGSLQAAQSTINGSGLHGLIGIGALQAQDSIILGTASGVRSGSGVLLSQESTVNGIGVYGLSGSGSLNSQEATVEGSGSVSQIVEGTGILQAQPATITGTGLVGSIGTGILQSGPAYVTGEGIRSSILSGNIQAQPATIDSFGFHVPIDIDTVGVGYLQSSEAFMSGIGTQIDGDKGVEIAEFELRISRSWP